jgi:hypothetical protein
MAEHRDYSINPKLEQNYLEMLLFTLNEPEFGPWFISTFMPNPEMEIHVLWSRIHY